MKAINYGLTMPPEHWEIVEHSVHLYCDWLGCLLPAPVQSQGQKSAQHLPQALIANPLTYAPRLLSALCRFFTPRSFSKTGNSDPTDTLFGLMHQPSREPSDSTYISTGESVKEIQKGKCCCLVDIPFVISLDFCACDVLIKNCFFSRVPNFAMVD